MSWTHRRFLCFRRTCGGALFLLPLSVAIYSTFLPVMPPVMRLHLIGAVFCDGRGQIGLTHRRSCAFDGRAVACLSYSPFRWLSTHLPSRDALTSTCILFAALRACWSRRSQVDVRARRALSGARRQAEFDAFGAGDAMVATSRAPTPTWLGLALLLLDAASAPLLSACAALQYRRCFPAASATRRLDQVPVEPGLLLRLLLQSCWGVHPPLPLWRQGDHLRNPSGMVAPRQRQDLFSSSSTAGTTSRRVPCFARRATAAAAGTLSPQRSPWSQPPRRRVGWSFSVAGASSRRLRLPRSIGC